jgi:hypothetical protein
VISVVKFRLIRDGRFTWHSLYLKISSGVNVEAKVWKYGKKRLRNASEIQPYFQPLLS